MQVLSFRVVEGGSIEEIASRLNPHLPPTVGMVCSRLAGPKFHAAWSSMGKEYRYRLLLEDDPKWDEAAWRVDVDPAVLARVSERVVGTHLFSAFHDSSSAIRARTITEAAVVRRGPLVDVRIRGDAFGRYMVRQLIGGMIDVALGASSLESFEAALDGGTLRPTRAPAKGLVLWEIFYPRADDPFALARAETTLLPRSPPFGE